MCWHAIWFTRGKKYPCFLTPFLHFNLDHFVHPFFLFIRLRAVFITRNHSVRVEDNGFDALKYFFSKRLRDPNFHLEDMPTLLPSYKKALRHFHDVMALGDLPNPKPLYLSAIIINALPLLSLFSAYATWGGADTDSDTDGGDGSGSEFDVTLKHGYHR